MKNFCSAALVAATVLSLASCGDGDKAKKNVDSTSTTTVKIDSSTKTTAVKDSTVADTVKVAAAKPAEAKKMGGSGDGSTSMRALKDSFKKDSAKLSRK